MLSIRCWLKPGAERQKISNWVKMKNLFTFAWCQHLIIVLRKTAASFKGSRLYFGKIRLVYIAMNAHFWYVKASNFCFRTYPDWGNLVGDFKEYIHYYKNKHKASGHTD